MRCSIVHVKLDHNGHVMHNTARSRWPHQGAQETLLGEIGKVLFDKIGIKHRPVEGNEVCPLQEGAVQRSDIAVPDEDLRVRSYAPVIEPRQQAPRAIAAAHAHDRPDLAVGEHPHQVARPFAVAARQKTPAPAHIRSQLGLESQPLKNSD